MPTTKSQIERVIEHCHDGIVVFDKDGAVLLANPAAEAMVGKGSLVGQKLDLTGSVDNTLEVTLGSEREVELRFSTVPWGTGMASMATLRDVTERRNAERKAQFLAAKLRIMNDRLAEAATLDPLTGLLNRRGMEEALRREVRHARRMQSPLSALLLDCDDFKSVNDSHGYTTGDAVLVEMAKRMHSSTRTTDHLARVGGDEFLALLPGTPEGIAVQLAERIRSVASRPLPNRDDVRVTCSISAAQLPLDISSLEGVIGILQDGVHHSKAQGKDRVSGGRAEREVPGLANALVSPMAFDVDSTPIVDLIHGMRPIGWHLQPRFQVSGLESPAQFLRAAEENHLRPICDLAALESCLGVASRMPANSLCLMEIDPLTIVESTPSAILQALGSVQAAYSLRICLRLRLDPILMSDPNRIVEPLEQLRKRGLSFAIDFQGLPIDALVAVRPETVIFNRGEITAAASSRPETERQRVALQLVRSVGADPMVENIEIHSELALAQQIGLSLATGPLFEEGMRRRAVAVAEAGD